METTETSFPPAVSVTVPAESTETGQKRPYNQSHGTWRRLGRKDEAHILKGIMALKPLYLIAEELGVNRHTLYNYIRNNMDQSFRDKREKMLDIAEAKLMKNVMDGNQNAIEFTLDRLGKNRGYGIKEIGDRNDVPIINIGKIEIKKPEDAPAKDAVDAEIVEEKRQEENTRNEE